MTNEEVKSRILMEMNGAIDDDALRKLKICLDKNFYGITVVDNCTEVATVDMQTNDNMISRFLFDLKISGLSDRTIDQYKRETKRFFLIVDKHYSEIKPDDIS